MVEQRPFKALVASSSLARPRTPHAPRLTCEKAATSFVIYLIKLGELAFFSPNMPNRFLFFVLGLIFAVSSVAQARSPINLDVLKRDGYGVVQLFQVRQNVV